MLSRAIMRTLGEHDGYIITDGNKPIGKGGKLPPQGDYNIWED